ncbi:MAG: diguanylate cyclase [Alcanivorax sp.]|nr:diguanylate cyclase [Alcanivorax sp.]
MLHLHRWKILAVATLANLVLLANLAAGDPKGLEEIAWLDIAGEGGAALLAFLWLGLILNSRPSGRVTNYLVAGLTGIFIAYWQDVLDEVIRLPEAVVWDHWVESGAMPLGMVLLTLGIYHWQREQLAINEQLRRRERIFREHRSFDRLTNLTSAPYLRRQLAMELGEAGRAVTLMMLDVNRFDHVRRQLGSRDADRLLQELAELLLLNLRQDDLLCRYAGDRFAVVLPGTGEREATLLAGELIAAVDHFAFKTRQGETRLQRLDVGLATARGDEPDALIERANQDLEARREQPAPA